MAHSKLQFRNAFQKLMYKIIYRSKPMLRINNFSMNTGENTVITLSPNLPTDLTGYSVDYTAVNVRIMQRVLPDTYTPLKETEFSWTVSTTGQLSITNNYIGPIDGILIVEKSPS